MSKFCFAGSPDILICGNCREMFSDLVDIIEHKKDYCKLRFTCKCDYLNLDNEANDANDNAAAENHLNTGGRTTIKFLPAESECQIAKNRSANFLETPEVIEGDPPLG